MGEKSRVQAIQMSGRLRRQIKNKTPSHQLSGDYMKENKMYFTETDEQLLVKEVYVATLKGSELHRKA